MKVASLFFLTISWAALMHGTGYAAASNPASQQTSPQSAANTASDHPRGASLSTTTEATPRIKNWSVATTLPRIHRATVRA
jgi:hypothetical protein